MNTTVILRKGQQAAPHYFRDTIRILQELSEHYQIPIDLRVEEGVSIQTEMEMILPDASPETAGYTLRSWQIWSNGEMLEIDLIQGDWDRDSVARAALQKAAEKQRPLFWVMSSEAQLGGNDWTAMQLVARSLGVNLVPVSVREAARQVLKDPQVMQTLLAGPEAGAVLTPLLEDTLGVFGVYTERAVLDGQIRITVTTEGKKGYLIPLRLGEALAKHVGNSQIAERVRAAGVRVLHNLTVPSMQADPLDLPLDDRWGLLLSSALTEGEGFAPRRQQIDESFSTII